MRACIGPHTLADTGKLSHCIVFVGLYWNHKKTWKFDISDCYSLLTVQNPAKTVYFKTYLKCPPPAFTQAGSLLTKLSMALLMEFCGRSSHIVWDFRRWYLSWVEMSFKHSSPHMVIKRIKIWWVQIRQLVMEILHIVWWGILFWATL